MLYYYGLLDNATNIVYWVGASNIIEAKARLAVCIGGIGDAETTLRFTEVT
jgi:hypothetical protein